MSAPEKLRAVGQWIRDVPDETTARFFALLKRLTDAGMCTHCASGAAIERAEKAAGTNYKPVALPCKQRDRKRVCADILASMRAQSDFDRREQPVHAGPLPAHRQRPAVAMPLKEEAKKAS